jgi:hypothetical protein
MAAEEILIEIDVTLDRLIQNAEALVGTDIQDLLPMELEAFQKTQESLIHHLIHTDHLLEMQRKGLSGLDKRSASYKISEKRARFEKLKSTYHKTLSATFEKKLPILSKRRSKRFLSSFG